MSAPPLVSVAIPAYNHAVFIEDCLASVCAQTYPELELVLIDDGSTDGTFEKAQRFLAAHPGRFRRTVLEQRQNQGVSANSNACIAACKGQWVHLLGSDDIFYPEKIERIQQAIETWNCPDLALVHADCSYIGPQGELVTRTKQKSRPEPGPDYQAYRWLYLGTHYVFNPTIALHREAFLAAGGFDPTLPLEDLDCWLRLSVKHALARVPEELAAYRKHPGNSSRKRLKMLAAQFHTYAKFLAEHPGLIEAVSNARHFRKNLQRYWRRIRKHAPWLLPQILLAAALSYWKSPSAAQYTAMAKRLDRAAPR